MGATSKEAISDFFASGGKLKPRAVATAASGSEEAPKRGGLEGLIIALLDAARPPVTPLEGLAVEFLQRGGPTLLSELVNRIADQLYLDEVRHGAAVLEIGLFGPALFRPEVTSELRAGDGVLWEIRQESDPA